MKQNNERSFYKGEPILALNWKQPYLDLMFLGKVETRSWPTNFRGYVLMCGSKKSYNNFELLHISGNKQFGRIEECHCPEKTGMALYIGKLVDCRPMTKLDEDSCFVEYKEPWIIKNKRGMPVEKKLWCHIYEDVRYIRPIEFSAGQGWSFVPQEILNKIVIIS